ncbi:MAG: hypothetical protein V3V99_02380 [candidate division Zixibacteria bacterium]
MSATKKQINANKQNAQKSTGPKSEQGKLLASRNSLKHGLYASDIIVDTPAFKENEEEYDLLLASLFDELEPRTAFQQDLVVKIATGLWRSRRAVRAETAEINNQLENIERDIKQKQRYKNIIGISSTTASQKRDKANLIGKLSLPRNSVSFNILRYEMRLDRQLFRSFKLLQLLKEMNQLANNEKGQNEPNSPQSNTQQ